VLACGLTTEMGEKAGKIPCNQGIWPELAVHCGAHTAREK